jgi:hypothetical protein
MDEEIINLLPNKTVYYLHAIGDSENPVTAPYIEYEFYDENGGLYAEGEEVATNYFLQVDIFTASSFTVLEELVKTKMIDAGFSRDMAADFYEDKVKLYHKAIRFNYTSDII